MSERVICFLLISMLFVSPALRGSTFFGPDWPGAEVKSEDRFQITFTEGYQTNPNTAYIPFTLTGRLITVQARVDSLIGNFFFDTGAERLLLNSNYFEPQFALSGRAAIGSTGKLGDVGVRDVDTLFWENMHFYDIRTNILDLSHIEETKHLRLLGIIGYNVFSEFEVFIDFQFYQIILTRLDAKGSRLDSFAIYEQPYDSLDFYLHRHLIILDAEVDGISLSINLDTGAELNLLDRRVKRRVLDHFEILKRVRLIGAGEGEVEVLAGILRDLRCGRQTNPGMNTLLTSLDEMNRNFQTDLDGVMGFEFIASRRLLINYKKKKLYFFNLQRP